MHISIKKLFDLSVINMPNWLICDKGYGKSEEDTKQCLQTMCRVSDVLLKDECNSVYNTKRDNPNDRSNCKARGFFKDLINIQNCFCCINLYSLWSF